MIILSLVAVAAVGAALYVKTTQPTPTAQTEQEALQEAEQQANVDPKTNNESYSRNQQTGQSGAATPAANASIYISSLSQDANNIQVSAIVDNQTTGTCTLTMTKAGSTTITRQAPLGLITSYYACRGFTIPKNELPAKGDWAVQVGFSNASASGTTEKKNLTVD